MNSFYKICTAMSIGIIILVALLFLVNKEMLLLASDDMSFHIMTAQGFVDNGGVTLWENWESNPQGRAHTYPPVHHVLITPLILLGSSSVNLFFWIGFIAVLSLLTISWWSLQKIFNPVVGLIFLILTSADATVINMLSITTPASIVIFCSPILLILFKNKKYVAATLLLTIFWYTHMIFAYVVAFALLLWAWQQREHVQIVFKCLGISYLLYIPWLVQLISNYQFLRYFHESWPATINLDKTASLNVVLVAIFIVSLLGVVWKFKKQAAYKDLFFFFGIIVAASPLLVIAPLRFFSSMGMWAMLVCSACFISYIFHQLQHRWQQLLLSVTLLGLVSYYPVVMVNLTTGGVSTLTDKNIFLQGIHFMLYGEGHDGMLLHYAFTENNLALARIINQNSNRSEPLLNISSQFNLIQYYDHVRFLPAQFFAALANRPMANARYPENQWYTELAITKAPIVLADYQQTNQFPNQKSDYEQRVADVLDEQFNVIGEADRLVAFRNKNIDVFEIKPVQPAIPLWIALLLVYGSIAYIGSQAVTQNTPDNKNIV